ncbi:hypothetical protein ACVXG7_05085 [Enterobacter hormaechei]
MVQQQGLPWFAFQFATAQQGADIAVADFIELLGDGESRRGSKTPTTMQALRCFSGLPLLH